MFFHGQQTQNEKFNYNNWHDKLNNAELKKRYPDIVLYLLAPYALTQKRDVPVNFDGSFYPEGLEKVPFRYAIVQANKYMVQNSDYLISYCHHIGNTRNIVEYAQRREKKGLIKVTLL